MVIRLTKFASAIVASVVAITIFSFSSARAAGDCQTEPRSEAPQGQHWYYRIERGTKRHCWYLREAGERPAQAEAAADAAAPPRPDETAASRSVTDAYAELSSTRPRVEQEGGASAARRAPVNAPSAAAPADSQSPGASAGPGASAPADGVPLSPVASRWPEPSAVSSSVNPAAEALATVIADASPTPQMESSATPPPVTLADAPEPTPKMANSLELMLLAIFGALALVSLTGSMVVYQFRRARRVALTPARQGDNWQPPDHGRSEPSGEIQPERLTAGRADFARAGVQTSPPEDGIERLEVFLARLSKLAQNDMNNRPRGGAARS
jgi:hypothetical protein